jgi:predicted anti-sigma-YlaC factor YlaD
MHAACDRARQWVSADVDGELSRFERVLLAAHTSGCASCREFEAATVAATSVLRAAPLEHPERPIEVRRVRRRLRVRLAPATAAAAMAVVAVGLASTLSSGLRSGPVAGAERPDSALAAVDTINLGTVRALERSTSQPARVAPRRQPAGGPVVQDR